MVLASPGWAAAALGVTALLLPLPGAGGEPPVERRIDFAREVRPILSDKCFTCHGPDEAKRRGSLRLDTWEGATAPRQYSPPAVVPGDAAGSALVERILADDPEDRMPPAKSGRELSDAQREVLVRWIEQGAEWTRHWSFVRPQRPEPPEVQRADWPRNPIDRFVLARLESEGLEPSPEASRETLLRRVTLDLTGLPPTPEELEAFLADTSPGAYERVVERLLSSSAHAEQQARRWLDVARYGDTHGLHLDNERSMWRWRDWVIQAFEENKPFDLFTIEQLAGDLLPEASLEQRIATGFNRCNVTTAEGGLIAEEYLAKYAMDRVDTTASVWLGVTMGCAQCHDHKFDPFSQREYYRLLAYFNNVAEEASDGNIPTPPPRIRAPRPAEQAELERLEVQLRGLDERLAAPMPAVDAAQERWEAEQSARIAARWRRVSPERLSSSAGSALAVLEDDSVLVSGANPQKDVYRVEARPGADRVTAVQLRALPHESLPLGGAGRAHNSNFVLTGFELELLRADGTREPRRFSVALADHSQPDFDVAGAIDADAASGWAISHRPEERTAVFLLDRPLRLSDGDRLRFGLRHESPYQQHGIGRFLISVSGDEQLLAPRLGTWYEAGPFPAASGPEAHATAFWPERAAGGAVDLAGKHATGAWRWRPRPDARDGAALTFRGENRSVYLYRSLHASRAGPLPVALGSDDGIKVWLNGEVVHDKDVPRGLTIGEDRLTLVLRAGTNHLLVKVTNRGGEFAFSFQRRDSSVGGLPVALERALDQPAGRRSAAQRDLVRAHFRATESPEWGALQVERDAAAEALESYASMLPTTMVMAERNERRQAHVLERGQYDRPGEAVEPGVPAVLHALTSDASPNRLGLARWLVDPANPLTARVQANRLWQGHFGTGLVRTAEDFGSQGEYPSHPELLDWLAVELVESGWDLRQLRRLMVTSASYRQAARSTPALLEHDPSNRLLARGPRLRLDAEEVRDQALALAGLLVDQVGGPSVRPYQPPGIWKAVAYVGSNTQEFVQGEGDDLYRRSLYTFWKRTAPPPTMALFDAPSRENCSMRRARTNTPLQALALLNDVQFVEAARALGERILREGGADDDARTTWAIRLVTCRRPEADERAVLMGVLDDVREVYATDTEAARALVDIGESQPDPALDPSELAAWTVAASVLLNLDETVTRP